MRHTHNVHLKFSVPDVIMMSQSCFENASISETARRWSVGHFLGSFTIPNLEPVDRASKLVGDPRFATAGAFHPSLVTSRAREVAGSSRMVFCSTPDQGPDWMARAV